jgi:hypothetical protein
MLRARQLARDAYDQHGEDSAAALLQVVQLASASCADCPWIDEPDVHEHLGEHDAPKSFEEFVALYNSLIDAHCEQDAPSAGAAVTASRFLRWTADAGWPTAAAAEAPKTRKSRAANFRMSRAKGAGADDAGEMLAPDAANLELGISIPEGSQGLAIKPVEEHKRTRNSRAEAMGASTKVGAGALSAKAAPAVHTYDYSKDGTEEEACNDAHARPSQVQRSASLIAEVKAAEVKAAAAAAQEGSPAAAPPAEVAAGAAPEPPSPKKVASFAAELPHDGTPAASSRPTGVMEGAISMRATTATVDKSLLASRRSVKFSAEMGLDDDDAMFKRFVGTYIAQSNRTAAVSHLCIMPGTS